MANKATSNLHTTRSLIFRFQRKIKWGLESLDLWEMKGLRNEASLTAAVLLALQIQCVDYHKFFLAKQETNLP